MKKLPWLAALPAFAAVVFVLIPRGAGQTSEEELWRHRNIGKALFETPASAGDAPAELKKALELAPDSFRERLNYGLALLRSGNTTGTKDAIVELERAQKRDPSLPHTWFNLGIAYKRAGRNADAIRQFQRMVELAPDEPVSHYNLGLLYNIAERGAEALQQFRLAARLDPGFVAPRFQIYTYYRLSGDEAEAARALADFQTVKARQEEAGEMEDVEWCAYAELYDPVQARPAASDATPPPALQFEDRKIAGGMDADTSGLLVLDAEGRASSDLLAWSRTGLSLYRGGKDAAAGSGLAGLQGIVSVAAGDYDNDGLPDLCILTANGARVYRNNRGRFVDSGLKLPSGRFQQAVWLDFDHDYDLDLFLLGDQSVLLRNQGNGAFEDYTAHFPFAPGRALGAAAFRAVPDTRGIDLAVSYAGRNGVLYRDRLRGVFDAEPLEAIPPDSARLRSIDIDNDSWTDLVSSGPRGVSVALNRQGGFSFHPTEATGAYVFADFENRGLADLAARNGVLRNQGLAQFAKSVQPAGFSRYAALAQADFDADGRPDLAAVAPDGSLHLLLNRTALKNAWLRVSLTGVKNLKMAPGAEIEIKFGDRYQKAGYEGVPLLFGLGRHTQADTVRISWPNGLIQNQPNEPASRAVRVKEAPRLAGSCPMVFTWNGGAFQFITDVLGVAPLGASSSDGEYFPVDHDEYVRIPAGALTPDQGRYRIRITEELHEVTYLDQAQLIAVDHPRDVEIFTNEKFKSPPFPEFQLFGVRKRIQPMSAQDNAGRDVLPAILRQDRVYASGFAHDYAGMADMHTLTLDFGPQAARDNRAVLLLDGWVDWADGSTFLNASQRPGGGLAFPYLQVKDGAGRWRTVIEDMGIPSGKPKTIAVDLSGKFLSASREIRIVTNLCVYWDEIFLSEDASAPRVRLTPLDAGAANLRLRGFSQTVIHPRREQPEAFEYAKWTPSAMWNQTPGLYTRYGDVRDLVLAPDDRFVIMGSGDELQLEYSAAGLPPLPAGWQRDFLVLIDGWAKDGDANTAFSQTVEPLPFHAMTRYPYPASERYPDDESHRAWRKQYNTRPAIGFFPPLLARHY
jgi:tetratricopeptide (TPR) repeat protein